MSVIAMNKADIDIFGEDSIAYVRCLDSRESRYAVVRECDGAVLAEDTRFFDYLGDIIRTMYSGAEYGSGDIGLYSDRHGLIYKFS